VCVCVCVYPHRPSLPLGTYENSMSKDLDPLGNAFFFGQPHATVGIRGHTGPY